MAEIAPKQGKIKIVSGSYGQNTQVWIDDKEITQYLTGVAVYLEVGNVNRVELQVVPSMIEIEAEGEINGQGKLTFDTQNSLAGRRQIDLDSEE